MIHKLAEGPLTLTVASVEERQGKFGAQYLFAGEDGTEVYLSKQTAERQLERLKLTPEQAVGHTLHMEQVQKNGATYTNISKVGATGAPAAKTAAVAAPAPVAKMSIEELGAIYGQCVAQAFQTLGAACDEAGMMYDASVIQAAAATLFIKATR